MKARLLILTILSPFVLAGFIWTMIDFGLKFGKIAAREFLEWTSPK